MTLKDGYIIKNAIINTVLHAERKKLTKLRFLMYQ